MSNWMRKYLALFLTLVLLLPAVGLAEDVPIADALEQTGTEIALQGGEEPEPQEADADEAAEVPAHVHAYIDSVLQEPTCAEAGVKLFACECGESYTEPIPALGHTFAEGVCLVCGEADPNYTAPTEDAENAEQAETPEETEPAQEPEVLPAAPEDAEATPADVPEAPEEGEQPQPADEETPDEGGEEQGCKHEHQTVKYFNSGNYSPVAYNGLLHIRYQQTTFLLVCEDCGEYLEKEMVEGFRSVEEHSFDNSGRCVYCGFKGDKKCKHKHTEKVDLLDTNKKYTVKQLDATKHVVTGTYVTYTVCTDCGRVVTTKTKKKTVKEWHEWDESGGEARCAWCGYANACGHEHVVQYMDSDPREGYDVKPVYRDMDDKDAHICLMNAMLYTVCEDCGQTLDYESYPEYISSQPHEFDRNGVCVLCGYKQVKPTSVTLEQKGTVKLNLGDTLALNATLAPEKAQSKLTWSTSDKKIAKVNTSGVVTPVKEGTATITVKTANGKQTTVKVKVVDPYKPTGIKLDRTGTVKLNMGETLQLNAALAPATARSKLTWSTSNKKIAKVSSGGVVTPVKEGTVTITVKTANGKKTTVKVKVVDPYKPTSVKLDKTGTVKLNMGDTLPLAVTLTPDTARSKLTWSTSDKRIAKVSFGGVVTPVKEGTVTITVKTANGKKTTVKVKVVDPYKPTSVKLDKTGTVKLNMGETLQLNAALAPATARSKLTWTSSNKKIAKVSSSGVVTPVKEGTATITVKTANGKKTTVKVKVVDPYKPTSVKLDKTGTVKLKIGDKLELAATLAPATARSKLTWSTSSKKIAKVGSSGEVTAVKPGTATITVKTANGKTASVKIKVVK